ncbi:hypothetical protein O0L34_g17431 [Tuta absoluta]|nr:hypothetical protein O0L34_g17431 [Tuta absoluta]
MLRFILLSLALTLLCKTTLAFCDRHSNFVDVNEIAKEVEKNFKYVEHSENSTAYLLSGDSQLSRLPKIFYDPPSYWDWRDKGVVSPVKDQEHCPACWAFAAVACIESQLAIWKKIKTVLSEQFLIDCIDYGKDSAPKCGDYPLLKAYSAISTEFGGVLAVADYRPYSASPGTCTYKKPPPNPLPVTGFARVKSNEDAMVEYIYNIGPLSAAINSKSMDKYHGNYIDEPTEEQCSSDPKDMNHAVLIVGYNYYANGGKSVPYWIIKNSWSDTWGDHGYYYLVRGRNACGIANDVSYAIVN